MPIDSVAARSWPKVWPYTRTSAAWFVAAFAALTVAWTLLGWAIVEWLEPSALGKAETRLSERLAESRTPTWNDLATLGSLPSNPPVKIGLMVVMLVALPLLWRRWHDWAFLLGALLLEVSVYGLTSYIVGRPRPPVERLAEAPTESWPSGHVAAAVSFYLGLAIIVGWHTTSAPLRWAARIGAIAMVVVMAVSRLYLGMHYLSDIVGGVALGAAVLAITLWILRRGLADRVEAADAASLPAQTTSLDLSTPQAVTAMRTK